MFKMSRDAGFRAGLLLLFVCYTVKCCVQRKVQANVPETLWPGYVVCKVDLGQCGDSHLHLTSSDPDFTMLSDGTVLTVDFTTVTDTGKSFSITVQDHNGHSWMVDVRLSLTDQASLRSVHKRTKRRWSPPPFEITENDMGPFPKNVELIGSDSSANYSVYYKIDGPGVTADPVNVFKITATGMVQALRSVDRERNPQIKFIAHAYDRFTNIERDEPLVVTVIVKDVNDNVPEFVGPLIFSVQEKCNMGTRVGQVNATDKDDPQTSHAKIKFTLLNGTNLFRIDPYSGVITTITDTLDREEQDKVVVGIEIKDMAGAAGGLSRNGLATVYLSDINDNPPTFREKLYKGQVMENAGGVLVLRIPVDDKDQKNTPNWKAVYEITKGNETGDFSIKTDPATNEGLLYVAKPQNYEKRSMLNLEVMARNEAPLQKAQDTWQKVPVEIAVGNVDEGPEFTAPVLQLKVKENVPNGTLIGTYTAEDPEKTSKSIKYYKLSDPGSWITVMDSTGELRTANTIDRESPLAFNGTYNVTVKAVDETQKSGTGTVMILIEDVNDNQPVITKSNRVMCSQLRKPRSMVIDAFDADKPPFSDPYSFVLGKEVEGLWKITGRNSTSAVVEQIGDLPNNEYKIPIVVKDLQGFGEQQTVNVRICDCENNGLCPAQRVTSKLGGWGVLAMLMGLLLLLLICLLFIFTCSTAKEKLAIADDEQSGGMLIRSNAEAPGEEVKKAYLIYGTGLDMGDAGSMDKQNLNTLNSFNRSFEQQTLQREGLNQGTMKSFNQGTMQSFNQGTMQSFNQGTMQGFNTSNSGQYGSGYYGNTFQKQYSNISTLDTWNSNRIYLSDKLIYFGTDAEGRFAEDILKPYGNEGMGSPVGSVGCCSILSNQDNLDFLNSLGPKFKPLADVCTSKS